MSSGSSSFSLPPSPNKDKNTVRYLKPDLSRIIYMGYVYVITKTNKDESKRFRCNGCSSCCIKIRGNNILVHAKNNRHKTGKFQQMNENVI